MRAVSIATVAAAIAPAAAHAEDASLYCISNNAANKCPAKDGDGNTVDKSFASFKDLQDYYDGTSDPNSPGPQSGDHIQVEPGTYDEAVNLDDADFMEIYGDATKTDMPVITSDKATTFATTLKNEGAVLTHLKLVNTAKGGTAFTSEDRFELHDTVLESKGAAVVTGTQGTAIFDHVTATSTATGTSAADIPLIQLNSPLTFTITTMDVQAADRATGILANHSHVATIDHLTSDAHGVDSKGKGGYALGVIGWAPGDSDTNNPNITIRRSKLYGGAFGLGAFSAQVHADNTLATSDGLAAPDVRFGPASGSDAVDAFPDPLPPSAFGGGGASYLVFVNVTGAAAGANSDGISVNAAGVPEDGNGFDYISAAELHNSIFRAAHAGVEALDTPTPDATYQPASISTDHVNFSSVINPPNRITNGDTVGVNDTDQIDDPMFVNPTVGPTGDLHVKNGSNTLEAGGDYDTQDTDLDGNPRTNPGGDLGAYESTGMPSGPGTPPGGTTTTDTTTDTTTPPTDTGTSTGTLTTPPPTQTTTPPVQTTDTIGTPPPVNNIFTVSKTAGSSAGKVTVSLTAPGAGTFSAIAKSGSKTVGTATKTVAGAGPVSLSISLTSSAKASLKKGKKLSVTVTTAFLPVGGTVSTATTKVTVKGKKKKKKKHHKH